MAWAHPEIGTFWEGPLTFFERLCMTSFVRQGHPFTFYCYGPKPDLPEGVEYRDAAEVIPEFELFLHFKSIASFADRFRVEMIRRTGKIWVDLDVVCHRPFPDDPYHFALAGRHFGNAVLKLPESSAALRDLNAFLNQRTLVFESHWKDSLFFRRRDLGRLPLPGGAFALSEEHYSDIPYTLFGPIALTHFLNLHGEAEYKKPVNAFYPLHPILLRRNYFRPKINKVRLPDDCLGVHHIGGKPFREKFRKSGFVPPHPGSFIGQLCTEFGIDPAASPYVVTS